MALDGHDCTTEGAGATTNIFGKQNNTRLNWKPGRVASLITGRPSYSCMNMYGDTGDLLHFWEAETLRVC